MPEHVKQRVAVRVHHVIATRLVKINEEVHVLGANAPVAAQLAAERLGARPGYGSHHVRPLRLAREPRRWGGRGRQRAQSTAGSE